MESDNNWKKMMENDQFLIKKLITVKKKKELTQREIVNLGSIMVLALYYS